MKRLLLAAGLFSVASVAQAQMAPGASYDLNGDGKVTAAEFKTVQTGVTLKRVDTNRDGKIAKDELQAVAGGGARGGMAAMMFSRRDTDKDGFISRAEMEVAAQGRFEKADSNKDGWLNKDEIESLRQNRGRDPN